MASEDALAFTKAVQSFSESYFEDSEVEEFEHYTVSQPDVGPAGAGFVGLLKSFRSLRVAAEGNSSKRSRKKERRIYKDYKEYRE